jgi:hypothetical protein
MPGIRNPETMSYEQFVEVGPVLTGDPSGFGDLSVGFSENLN